MPRRDAARSVWSCELLPTRGRGVVEESSRRALRGRAERCQPLRNLSISRLLAAVNKVAWTLESSWDAKDSTKASISGVGTCE